MRKLLPIPGILLSVLLASCGRPASEGPAPAGEVADRAEVNFANWVTEIAPGTLAGFERETGIHVNLELIESNVLLETKLLTGGSGNDVAVPSSNFLARLIGSGALRKLDRSRLKNLAHLDPVVLRQLEAVDPGNQYAVPYLWGTSSFAYNVARVRRALGREPPESLAMLFDPQIAERLAPCGITWIDGGGWLMVDLALIYLGRDPNSESSEDLAAAEAVLKRVRPYVRYIDSARFDTDLAAGETCIGVGPSGDLLQARETARTGGAGNEIRYVLPKEGAVMWIDVLVMPRDAPHPDAAHRLIDHLLAPAVIAEISNATRFRNANLDADALIDVALRREPGVYPAPEVLDRLHLARGESLEYSRRQTQLWTRIRSR